MENLFRGPLPIFIVRSIALIRSLVLFAWVPRKFNSEELESRFLTWHSERLISHRRVALVLAFLTWSSFYKWDLTHAAANEALDALLPEISVLRLLGSVFLGLSMFLVFSKDQKIISSEKKVTLLFSFLLLTMFSILCLMIYIIQFPMNYLFYNTGLYLVMLFMYGVMGLLSRPVLVLTVLFLILAYLILPANVTVERIQVDGHAPAASYYFDAAMTYTASFAAIGCLISLQLERLSRTSFSRELQLETKNSELVFAAIESASKTSALLTAKDELRQLAEDRDQEKTKFIADASHDLRQPLQALTSFLDAGCIYLARSDWPNATSAIESAKAAAELTRRTFGDIMEISKLDSGLTVPNLGLHDVNQILCDVEAIISVLAHERGVRLKVHYSRKQQFALTDPLMLQRVLSNLVTNAIVHNQPTRLRGPRVLVGVTGLRNRVRLDVVDTGVGIAEDKFEAIFMPFTQLVGQDRRSGDGVGLGLSIVRGMIRSLPEHRLSLTSRTNHGTRFSIEIPTRSDVIVMALNDSESIPEDSGIAGAYVLYIEDNKAVRASIEAVLGLNGAIVESFSSFEDLASAASSIERTPDLLLTDFRLDGHKTAIDVYELIQAQVNEDFPVIVVTGEINLSVPDAFIVIQKPVETKALLEKICAALT